MDPMSLAQIGKETLSIIDRGWYETRSGKRLELQATIKAAVAATKLYRPADVDNLLVCRKEVQGPAPHMQVTSETTAQAARRLVEDERVAHVLALNFASAKNPGGGFLGGQGHRKRILRGYRLFTPVNLHSQLTTRPIGLRHPCYTRIISFTRPTCPFFVTTTLSFWIPPSSFPLSPRPHPMRGRHCGAIQSLPRRFMRPLN